MKQYALLLVFLYVVLIISHSAASARLLPTNQGDDHGVNADRITHAGSSTKTEEDSLLNLMGLEECEENDEVCVKRRMVAEAHLDYIYTQHHKP